LLAGSGPRIAEAHPLAPALLEITERSDGGLDTRFKTSRFRARGSALEPVLPEGCRPIGSPEIRDSDTSRITAASFECSGSGLIGQTISIEGLEENRIDALVRIELRDGRRVQRVLRPSASSLVVPERPRALDVAKSYAAMGIEHILTGPDHLLFVFGLVLLLGGLRPLLLTLTAFTVGHSVTLSLAAIGWVRFPQQPIEVLIAGSVLVLALRLTRSEPTEVAPTALPWVMGSVFGLLHGLGFAGALAEVGLPEGEIPLALFSFNVGIELGQIAFVVPIAILRLRLGDAVANWPGWVRAVPVYVMGSLAAFWCIERSAVLLR